MPSVYGDTVNHFRAKLDYSTSQSNTAVSITAAAYMCSVAWGFDVSYVTSTVTINGSSSSTTTGFYSANGATVEKSMVSKTVSVSRGTSAKTVSLSAVVNNHSGYMNGTSTASATVTIPALPSYSVTYDANGGTGAPSSQTKWYGTTLTLSSTRPTREGYTFLSWNTSASGTGTSYAPGASYTANAALMLYAQWEQDYVAPAVTSASAYRVASSGSTAEDVSGAYAYASFSWAVDTTLTSGNTASSVTLAYRASGASSWTSMTASGTTSGTSGTVYGWFEADGGTSYEVRVSVTDTSGADGSTTTLTRSVGVASVPLSVGSAGRAVGILSAAPEEGLAIGGASVTLHDPEAGTSESWAMADLIALLSESSGMLSLTDATAYDSSFAPQWVMRGGWVQLMGRVATATADAVICTIPSDLIHPDDVPPSGVNRNFLGMANTNVSGQYYCNVYINSSRQLVAANACTLLDLSGVRFRSADLYSGS